jgi:hypothetical protein
LSADEQRVGDFVSALWFWHFAKNGENLVSRAEAFCFGLEQFFGDCSAIARIVQDSSSSIGAGMWLA